MRWLRGGLVAASVVALAGLLRADVLAGPELGIVPVAVGYMDGQPIVPAIAAGDGVSLVVWQRRQSLSDTWHIYGLRVRGSDGTALDPFPFRLASTSADQWHPAVAYDGHNFLVVWMDARAGAFQHFDIYGTRVRASDGAVLDPGGIAIATAGANQTWPAVAFDGARYVAAWGAGSGVGAVAAARIDTSGNVLDSPGVQVVSGGALRPVVACTASDCVVAWEDQRSTTNNQPGVYATRLARATLAPRDPAGGFQVAPGLPWWFGAYGTPAPVSVSSNGQDFFIAWQAVGGDVKATRLRDSDATLLDSPLLDFGAGVTPRVDFDGTNYMLAFIQNPASFNGAGAARVIAPSTGGTVASAGFAINFSSELALGFDGTRHLEVDDLGFSGGAISGARLGKDGTSLDARRILVTRAASTQDGPQIAESGTSYVLRWYDGRIDAPGMYYARVATSSGALEDGEGIKLPDFAETLGCNATECLIAGSGGFRGILATRVRTSDRAFLDGVPLRVAPGIDVINVRVASNSTDFLVVWQVAEPIYQIIDGTWLQVDDLSNVHGARVSADGTLLDTTPLVISAGTDQSRSPVPAGAGDRYLVAWSEGAGVAGRRVSAVDGSLLEATPIGLESVGGPPFLACRAMDCAVAYATSTDLRARRVALADGGVIGAPTTLSSVGKQVMGAAFDGVAYGVMLGQDPVTLVRLEPATGALLTDRYAQLASGLVTSNYPLQGLAAAAPNEWAAVYLRYSPPGAPGATRLRYRLAAIVADAGDLPDAAGDASDGAADGSEDGPSLDGGDAAAGEDAGDGSPGDGAVLPQSDASVFDSGAQSSTESDASGGTKVADATAPPTSASEAWRLDLGGGGCDCRAAGSRGDAPWLLALGAAAALLVRIRSRGQRDATLSAGRCRRWWNNPSPRQRRPRRSESCRIR
jgi:hypothetical protein